MKSRGGPRRKEEEDPSFLLAFLSAFLWLAERFDLTATPARSLPIHLLHYSSSSYKSIRYLLMHL